MTDVLLVAPSSAAGGAGRAFTRLAALLPTHDYKPRAVLLERGPLEAWLAEVGCPFEVIEMTRTRDLRRTLSVLRELVKRCRDVPLVVANESKGHAITGLAAMRAGTPCIWWQCAIAGRSMIDLAAAAVPAATVVCMSLTSAEAQRRHTRRRRVEAIYPGIDVEALRSKAGAGATIRARYGDGGPLVGVVARLQPWKGQELFLRAMALVAQQRPDAHFLVVGGAAGRDEDYRVQLARLVTELELDDRVTFTGYQDDVSPWFDALDVAVTASVGEPFGLVTIEAMALRAVAIGVRSAGTAEIIEHGSSGLLVPAADPVAMAHAVLEVLADPSLAQTLRDGGDRRVESFTDEAMTARFAELFAELTCDG